MAFNPEVFLPVEVRNSAWHHQLRSLITCFPQFKQGHLRYVIEAGIVVKFLFSQRSTPLDIDLLVYDETLIEKIRRSSPEWYHANTINNWLTLRGIRPTTQALRFLERAHIPVCYGGNIYHCLLPEVVATSKTFDFRGCEPRPKDIMDICYLHVGSAMLESIAGKLQGNVTN